MSIEPPRQERGEREIAIAGAGVLCHMVDDLPTLEGMLREGRGVRSHFFDLAAEAHRRAVPFLRMGVGAVNFLQDGEIHIGAERRFNGQRDSTSP